MNQKQNVLVLRQENDRLVQQIGIQQSQYKKLQQKYQKSLKQLALIVKANQTLKNDYDNLQAQMNRIIQQQTQRNKKQLKQYINKELDQLNANISKLTEEKEKLIIQNNSLSIRINSIQLQKSKIEQQKQQLFKSNSILKAQLSSINPQIKQNQKAKLYQQQIKLKSIRIQELQVNLNKLTRQKDQQEKQFIRGIRQIQQLWEQYRYLQNQITKDQQKNQIKLKLNHSINDLSNKLFMHDSYGLNTGKRSTLVYQEKQIANSRYSQLANSKLKLLQKQNQSLKAYIENLKQSQKIIEDLRIINSKLTEEKMNIEDKYENVILEKAISSSRKNLQQNSRIGVSHMRQDKNNQQDLISILKNLHQQLSPLRRQITMLKRQQSQKNLVTSNDRANFQVKIIKLQKQLDFYKQHHHMLKNQLLQYKSQRQLIHELQKKNQQLEEQKNILQGRIIVMESLNVTDRTRVNSDTYNTLKQFEKRIELLIQDPHILNDLQGNHLQQLVAMKAYILQLDERLKQIGIQNQKLMKKYTYSKQKIYNINIQLKQVQNRQMTKILMYKQKLQAYDKLVEKLTLQLQKNITKRQSNSNQKSYHLSSELQFNQVVNLYQQKMINMGQEIVRIRKDKEYLQTEMKGLHQQVNKKIRQLNDKQRDIVILKTENINIQNYKNNLEKQLLELKIQNQFYKQNKQYKGQSLEKSRFISILEQENYQIKSKYQQEVEKIKQIYENQIGQLRKGIYKLENKLHQIQYEKTVLQRNGSSMKKIQAKKQNQVKQKQIKHNKQLEQNKLELQQKTKLIKQLQQKNQTISNNFTKQIQKTKRSFLKTQEQKNLIISTLQSQINKCKLQQQNYQRKINQLGVNIDNKNIELKQLEEVIQKNNYEITLLRNQRNRNNYYKIQNQHMRTQSTHQFLQENAKLHNQLYEKNIKIQGLQSIIFNLKLQNQRIKSQINILSQKYLANDLEIKNNKNRINQLENQTKNADSRVINNYDMKPNQSTQQVIRVYQNQIKQLKFRIQQLETITKLEQQKRQNQIRQLQEKLQYKSIAQSYIYNEQNRFSPEVSPQRKWQIENYKVQIKELSQQIIQKSALVIELNSKITVLQESLKKSENNVKVYKARINQLESQIAYNKPNSDSNVSENLYQQLQSLKFQILDLQSKSITLKDQLQFKENKISQLKHQIYKLTLQNKRLQKYQAQSKNYLSKSNVPRQEQPQIPQNQIQYHPASDPIQPYVDGNTQSHFIQKQQQALIKQLRTEIQHLKAINQELFEHQEMQEYKIQQLNQDLIAMTQNIKRYQSNESNLNNQAIQQLQRLRRLQNISESQRCKALSQQIDDKQRIIQQLKKQHQLELQNLISQIKFMQNQLMNKNVRIQELARQLEKSQQSQKAYSQNNVSPSKNNNKFSFIKRSSQASVNLIHSQSDIQYLLSQISRLTQLNKQLQMQVQQLNIQISAYEAERSRYKQNLSLLVLLNIEIQSLRNQLNQKNQLNRQQLLQMLDKLKIKKLSSIQGDKVDFEILKELDLSHQYLVNYIKQTEERMSNYKDKQGTQHQNEIISYPSESIVSHSSNNNIDSSYSLKNPLKKYYRHAESTYNPLVHSPKSPSFENNAYITSNKVILGSFGKISQSQNVQSSYGSSKSGLQSSEYSPQQKETYSFTLKNVNMISSVNGKNDDNKLSATKLNPMVQSSSSISYRQQNSQKSSVQEARYEPEKNYTTYNTNNFAYPYSSYASNTSSIVSPSFSANYSNLNPAGSSTYSTYNNSNLLTNQNYSTVSDYSKIFDQPTYSFK